MGYYTRYELEVDTGRIDHERQISQQSEYAGWDAPNVFDDEIKWYGHEEDMRKYSLNHPGILFTLKGEGEEPGDLWRKYFKDGRMQRCEAQIIFPPFDESKLN